MNNVMIFILGILLFFIGGFVSGIAYQAGYSNPRLAYPQWNYCEETTVISNGRDRAMLHCERNASAKENR